MVAKSLPKPKKRPTQDRAKFTLQAIYDAYVRIWRARGVAAVTMRNVAEEAGFAIGTLYEYFPNITALHSGYIRHTIDTMTARIDREVVAPPGLTWQARVGLMVRIICGVDEQTAFFDGGMMSLVGSVAEPRHHHRVFAEITARWAAMFAACKDLQPTPDAGRVEALVMMVWGARRYHLLLHPDARVTGAWVGEIEFFCVRALTEAAGREAARGLR